jgi:hypothetical protein
MIFEVADHHVGAFASKRQRDSAPNAAVAPGDHGDTVLQTPVPTVAVLSEVRARLHLGFAPGPVLFLGWSFSWLLGFAGIHHGSRRNCTPHARA